MVTPKIKKYIFTILRSPFKKFDINCKSIYQPKLKKETMKNVLKLSALAIVIVISVSACDYFSTSEKNNSIDTTKIDTSSIDTNRIDTAKINSNQKNAVLDTLKQ
jgi:hypothetical protein